VPIPEDQLSLFPKALSYHAGWHTISAALGTYGFVFLYDAIKQGSVDGLPADKLPLMLDNVDSDVLLVEADHAAGLPFKAPRPAEPSIPTESTLVIPVTSLSALGQTLDARHVYNPQSMIEHFGFYAGSKIRLPWVAQVLRDDTMGLKGVPESARVVGFINQTPDKGYMKTRARQIAKLALRSPRFTGVALGSIRNADSILEVHRPIGAVVLAAGQSTRMGQPKMLLPWADGKTIIEHIVEQLVMARIDEIVVVTGHYSAEIRERVQPFGVKIAFNKAYKTGEMLSSLQTGLRAMSDHISAALMVLGDQPQMQPRVLYRLLKAYAEGAGQILIPSYQMQRGHPILLGRRYWHEMCQLEGDASPRQVMDAHKDEICHIVVDTDTILHDVDTPSDYRDARRRAGLPDTPLRRSGSEG
jgi:molybdenum cofactor cytidylyltransferase